jgi:hypothetical protein
MRETARFAGGLPGGAFRIWLSAWERDALAAGAAGGTQPRGKAASWPAVPGPPAPAIPASRCHLRLVSATEPEDSRLMASL